MPIRPEMKSKYPKDWPTISARIKARADWQCECRGECGLHRGRRCKERHGQSAQWAGGTVILTTAHLDHDPANCADDNLKAMCQRCHNRYDMPYRRMNAANTRDRKRGQGKLFDDPARQTPTAAERVTP